jgi:hypothetical protein
MILLIFLIGCCMGAYAEIITIPSLTLQPGEEKSVEIRMDQAPHGLSGYTLIVNTQGSATITSGEGPAWAALKNADLVDSHTLSVSAADLMDEIKSGSTQVLLATVMVTGAAGQTTFTATVKQMDDDDGNAIVPVIIPGKIDSGNSPTPTTMPTTPVPTQPTTLPTTLQPTPIPTQPTTSPTTLQPTPVPTQPTISPTTLQPTPIPTEPTILPTTLPTTIIPPTPTEITYELDRGWNLIGIPAQPIAGYETAFVFSQVPSDGHSMFQYGPSGWESVNPATPLRAMDAYWIYTNTPFVVTIQVQEVSGSCSFQSGWNLISPPGFAEKRATEVFSSLVWSYLTGYDGKTQQYDMIVIMGVDDSFIVRPGHGYWIYLQDAGTVSY